MFNQLAKLPVAIVVYDMHIDDYVILPLEENSNSTIGVCGPIDDPPDEFIWLRDVQPTNNPTIFACDNSGILYSSEVVEWLDDDQILIDANENEWIAVESDWTDGMQYLPSEGMELSEDVKIFVIEEVMGPSAYQRDIENMLEL